MESVELKEKGENGHFTFLSEENYCFFFTVFQNIEQKYFFENRSRYRI